MCLDDTRKSGILSEALVAIVVPISLQYDFCTNVAATAKFFADNRMVKADLERFTRPCFQMDKKFR